MRRTPSVERRVAGVVAEARLVVGDYGVRPVTDEEARKLAGVFNLESSTAELSVPAILFPPVAGKYRLVMDAGLPRPVRRYVQLHELSHVLAGEADEPMQMVFEGRLPENEDVADLFALLGIVDPFHDDQGARWLEEQLRNLVPLDDIGWQKYRIPRLAKKLPRARLLVRNLHGYF